MAPSLDHESEGSAVNRIKSIRECGRNATDRDPPWFGFV